MVFLRNPYRLQVKARSRNKNVSRRSSSRLLSLSPIRKLSIWSTRWFFDLRFMGADFVECIIRVLYLSAINISGYGKRSLVLPHRCQLGVDGLRLHSPAESLLQKDRSRVFCFQGHGSRLDFHSDTVIICAKRTVFVRRAPSGRFYFAWYPASKQHCDPLRLDCGRFVRTSMSAKFAKSSHGLASVPVMLQRYAVSAAKPLRD